MGERDRGSQRDKDKKRHRNERKIVWYGRENDRKRDRNGRVTERKDR